MDFTLDGLDDENTGQMRAVEQSAPDEMPDEKPPTPEYINQTVSVPRGSPPPRLD